MSDSIAFLLRMSACIILSFALGYWAGGPRDHEHKHLHQYPKDTVALREGQCAVFERSNYEQLVCRSDGKIKAVGKDR